ncbi:MAG: class I SAM-dependent methyltransferase [Rubrivivax sp.]
MHGGGEPSPWVRRWAHLIRPGGSVLDVACGSGRHLRWLAAQGFRVTGVDRDAAGLAALADVGETLVADIEGGPWPLPGRRFDAVVVTNYLWRPLAGVLRESLAEGGLYLHETFADGNAAYGRPSRPEFLLREGELLALTQGLHVVAYEHGRLDDPPRVVQRVAALAAPGPHPLGG